jgi:hypothetical protein
MLKYTVYIVKYALLEIADFIFNTIQQQSTVLLFCYIFTAANCKLWFIVEKYCGKRFVAAFSESAVPIEVICGSSYLIITFILNKHILKNKCNNFKDFTVTVHIRKSVNFIKSVSPYLRIYHMTGNTDIASVVYQYLLKKAGAWIRKPVSIWCDHHLPHAV